MSTKMQETNSEAHARLIEERDALALQIARLQEDVKVELDHEADEADPELAEREKNLSLLATFEERLEEVELALTKLQQGDYGICKSCGKPIDPERLAIVPETQYCVSCKSKMEKRHRR